MGMERRGLGGGEWGREGEGEVGGVDRRKEEGAWHAPKNKEYAPEFYGTEGLAS